MSSTEVKLSRLLILAQKFNNFYLSELQVELDISFWITPNMFVLPYYIIMPKK
uniref:FI14515p1 n=1 Tax=Drosophila melanogaster TaxID=7227 RepID=G2J653_DROME|nr:FI14515p1 [Drosophila melanogaster]